MHMHKTTRTRHDVIEHGNALQNAATLILANPSIFSRYATLDNLWMQACQSGNEVERDAAYQELLDYSKRYEKILNPLCHAYAIVRSAMQVF